MSIKLHGILILDTTYTDMSIKCSSLLKHINFKEAYTHWAKTITPPNTQSLKQKLDYEEEEDENVRGEQ